jgi:hypothetical protein
MRNKLEALQLFFEKKSCAKELKKSKGMTAYEKPFS